MLLGFHLSPNVLGADIRGKLVPSLGSVKEEWSATHTPPEHLFPVLCSYCALNGATNIHCQVPIKQHQPRPPHLHSAMGWGCFFIDPTHTTSGGQRWPMPCGDHPVTTHCRAAASSRPCPRRPRPTPRRHPANSGSWHTAAAHVSTALLPTPTAASPWTQPQPPSASPCIRNPLRQLSTWQ